jgi:hypothetical protein
MPAALDAYVRGGGRVLVAGTAQTQGYWRIHDRARLPGLAATDRLFVDGDYVELAPIDAPILTLIGGITTRRTSHRSRCGTSAST